MRSECMYESILREYASFIHKGILTIKAAKDGASSLRWRIQPCALKRRHMVIGGHIPDTIAHLLGRESFALKTVCTCQACTVHAALNRLRISPEFGRPHILKPRFINGFRERLRVLYRELASYPIEEQSLEQVVDSFHGPKRAHYAKALEMYRLEGLGKMDFEISGKWGERNVKPRPRALCIQRSMYIFQGVVLFLRTPILIESVKRRRLGHSMERMKGRVRFAGGHQLTKRARYIFAVMAMGYACWSIDLKSFDGSQDQLANIEREIFAEVFGLNADERKVLRAQNASTLHSTGLEIKMVGKRHSGTAGTSTANKGVMVAALAMALGPSDYKLYCDGDDTLVFVREEEANRFKSSWIRRLKELDLEVDEIGLFTKPEDVEFCRAKPIMCGFGPMLVKHPLDMLSNVFNLVRTGSELRDYLYSYGQGMRIFGGVPILDALPDIFPKSGHKLEIDIYSASYNPVRVSPVTEDARLSFEAAFGISSETQKQIEHLIRRMAGHYEEAVSLAATGEPVIVYGPLIIGVSSGLNVIRHMSRLISKRVSLPGLYWRVALAVLTS